jgi:hypothetical protein
MPDRAGYTLSLYAIDVSPSMGEQKEDDGGGKGKGKGKTRLQLVKEFVARKCEPKVSLICSSHTKRDFCADRARSRAEGRRKLSGS